MGETFHVTKTKHSQIKISSMFHVSKSMQLNKINLLCSHCVDLGIFAIQD